MVQVVRNIGKVEESGEISPLLQETVKLLDINSSHEYIVEATDNQKRHGEIPPEAVEEKGKNRLRKE